MAHALYVAYMFYDMHMHVCIFKKHWLFIVCTWFPYCSDEMGLGKSLQCITLIWLVEPIIQSCVISVCCRSALNVHTHVCTFRAGEVCLLCLHVYAEGYDVCGTICVVQLGSNNTTPCYK